MGGDRGEWGAQGVWDTHNNKINTKDAYNLGEWPRASGATRSNLTKSDFQNFPGGHASESP